jgi:hypothetical protein
VDEIDGPNDVVGEIGRSKKAVALSPPRFGNGTQIVVSMFVCVDHAQDARRWWSVFVLASFVAQQGLR